MDLIKSLQIASGRSREDGGGGTSLTTVTSHGMAIDTRLNTWASKQGDDIYKN